MDTASPIVLAGVLFVVMCWFGIRVLIQLTERDDSFDPQGRERVGISEPWNWPDH